MTRLLTQAKENFSFVLMCVLIIVALSLLSKFAEKFFPQKRSVSPARRITIIAICSAIATVLHVLDFPLLFLAPDFYKLDFSELPVMLCGFYLGPSAAVFCEVVKILLKLLLKGTATAFVGGLAKARLNGVEYYIDRSGNCLYDFCDLTPMAQYGCAVVGYKGRYGLVGSGGVELVSCKYDHIGTFADGLAPVSLNGKWGYIDTFGREVIICRYDKAEKFSEGLAQVHTRDNIGYINTEGRLEFVCRYDGAEECINGSVVVNNGSRKGLVDRLGKELIPCLYEQVEPFVEGYAKVRHAGRWGFAGVDGREEIGCIYEEVENFSGGVAKVKLDGKWGLVGVDGREVLPCVMDEIGEFVGRYAPCTMDGHHGYLHTCGEYVVLD